MTDPRDFERHNEVFDSPAWEWILGIGTAALVGYLVIVNYSTTMESNTPYATANAPPHIAPSNAASGAQPEQPAQFKPSGMGR